MSLAVIFNGQGAHYQEMGQDFAQAFPEAEAVYEKVEALTEYPIRQWITDDLDALQETRYAQVAIASTSIAIFESIKSQLPAIEYMAGLSLGEYTSLIASGMLDVEEGFELLKERGQLMTAHCNTLRETSDIVMEAVLKMPLDEVQAVIAEVNQEKEQLYLANLNSSTQVTIAGTKEAVEQFKERARKRGYRRVMPLKVEGPFHSPYMAPVCAPYEKVLADVTFKEGKVPVISNTTVRPHTTDEVADLLVRHLVESVRWQETIAYFVDQGVDKIIQIGPGKTLASLLKREPNAPDTLVIDKVSDLDKIESFLGG
jgi:[acyl-carrier-protein] S-malonyltransferase